MLNPALFLFFPLLAAFMKNFNLDKLSGFERYCLEAIDAAGLGLSPKKMFGCVAFLQGHTILAIARGGRLYIKAHPSLCADLADPHLFTYEKKGKTAKLNMLDAGAEPLENPELLRAMLSGSEGCQAAFPARL